ncbi:hypothetical protein SacmaDRAFT_4369 [Saccharomonospora marina XMU15]|uniref:Uncharacterized protein n=1 Tax=Saccharomonospora marina XMU15 TaxID=882083 RepID=H5X8Y0_9PSEU|nr:Rv3235 family protein [Saccharomonospora marina]EHR52555.1 hypothetical protein SacmaDRAFT_4369 [Saccharomonospora marina XMU15]
MRTNSARSGLLPLTPYEPVDRGGPAPGPVVPEGQLTLDELLEEARQRDADGEPLPELGRRAIHGVLAALLEVHTGRRPLAQLAGWLAPALFHALRVRTRASATRYALRHIHICRPSEHTVEVCGTAYAYGRASAVAARFEHGEQGWRCTTFTVLATRRPMR